MGTNGNGKDHDKKGKAIFNTERRAENRLTDEEFEAIYNWFLHKAENWVGKKVLRGVGWLLLGWTAIAIAEFASGGKISLGAAIRLLMEL